MTYMTTQAERYFNESALREDVVNAIDATTNISIDEAQAAFDVMSDEVSLALINYVLTVSFDNPTLERYQSKIEDLITSIRTETDKKITI